MAPVVSQNQIEFFEKLTREKQFPAGTDTASLIEQFKALNSGSGSSWIEKALSLPDADEGPVVPPAF
jgi:hypothetical protein